MSHPNKQSEMQIVKQLVGYISTWLYSDDVFPPIGSSNGSAKCDDRINTMLEDHS